MATLLKEYIHQVYSGDDGSFLGTLANVKSDFQYTNNINSAGPQLEIVLGANFDDVGAVQTDEFLIDESSNKFTDEVGNHITASAVFDFNNIPIGLGNRIKVIASYDGSPSGKTVFDGFISKWATDYVANTITLTVLSWGAQLDNFIIQTDPTSQTIDQELYDSSVGVEGGAMKGGSTTEYAQSFNIASPTTIGSIIVFMAGSDPFTMWDGSVINPYSSGGWDLYSGTPAAPGALVDTGTFGYLGSNVQQITLALTQPLSLNGNYFIHFHNFTGGTWYYGSVTLEVSTANPYAGGSLYSYDTSTAAYTQIAGSDLAFIVQSSSGSSQLSFENTDPGSIVRRVLDQLNSQGGRATYTTGTVLTTSTNVSYDYKLQTILEGIQRMLALSPDGWYFYLDPGTNYFYFRAQSLTADHSFILGKHIAGLNIEFSLEQVKNSVYFSGGDTGAGANLFVASKNAGSTQKYGQWLDRISDNRVTDATTADTIVAGELATKSEPLFQTTVDILAADYDIETIDPGDMVQFRNFGNLIDTLLFQVVGITRTPDKATLNLGMLPPRASAELDNINRRLDLLETVANPTTPS